MYTMAANRGHAEAQCRLGDAYEHGLYGLKRNEQEALKWYRQAAEGGDTGAQCRFGEAYEESEEGALGLKTEMLTPRGNR